MRDRLIFTGQLVFTLIVAAFLVVPAILSIMAGVTVNYFRGISSGVTLQWVFQVWDLYAGHHPAVVRDRVCDARRHVAGRRSRRLRAARPWRPALAHRRGNHHPAACDSRARDRAGAAAHLSGFSDFRRSWLFILTGHVIFTMPFMVRSVMAVFATIDIKTLDEGAASLGASPWRRFRDVIVPNAVPGILAGALMVVTLSLGEFNLTWMLHTPLTKTLPIGLADSYASMRLEVASAYTLIFFVMIIPLLVAMQLFADKEQKDDDGLRDMGRQCVSRPAARPLPMARVRSSRLRSRSPVAKRWCCSAPPAAARPPCCASSPGSNCRMPAAGCCSTTRT